MTDESNRRPAREVGPRHSRPAAAAESRLLHLPALLEALLFVAPSPIPWPGWRRCWRPPRRRSQAALDDAGGALRRRTPRAPRRCARADRVHLTTAPEAPQYIEKFLGLDLSTKLSGAALETLAVIAYRQPLTRGDIEAIRGVNCDGVLKTLLARALVEPVGRLEQPGRPFLYGTTLQFLQYFGLEGLDRLPPLADRARTPRPLTTERTNCFAWCPRTSKV